MIKLSKRFLKVLSKMKARKENQHKLFYHLIEEVGELGTDIRKKRDTSLDECGDVIRKSIQLYFQLGGDFSDLVNHFEKKEEKHV